MLEIVEGEAIRSTGAPRLCFAARGAGQRGFLGRENSSGIVPLSMPSGRLRYELRSLRPSGSAQSGRWRNASNRPVLKHGPRRLPCMRVGGWKTHEAQVT